MQREAVPPEGADRGSTLQPASSWRKIDQQPTFLGLSTEGDAKENLYPTSNPMNDKNEGKLSHVFTLSLTMCRELNDTFLKHIHQNHGCATVVLHALTFIFLYTFSGVKAQQLLKP